MDQLTYLICSSPRVGSTLLADALYGMDLGNPTEVFYRENFDLTLVVDSLANVKAMRGAHGILGMKAHYHQLAGVPGLVEHFTEHFPRARYVYLTRDNIVRQAISLARALQTGQWCAHFAAKGTAQYDAGLIQRCLAFVALERERWEDFFAFNGIMPLRVQYDALACAYPITVGVIAGFLGFPDREVPAPRISQQADQLTDVWYDRFTARFQQLEDLA